jgi:hypothetical protein
MIDKLIKLANDMDAKGLTAEADRLDAIISKMAGEGEGPEEKLKTKEELVQYLFGEDAFISDQGTITSESGKIAPFNQALGLCSPAYTSQCSKDETSRKITIVDENKNEFYIFEEEKYVPGSKIKIEMSLLN